MAQRNWPRMCLTGTSYKTLSGSGGVAGSLSCQLPLPSRDLAKAFMQAAVPGLTMSRSYREPSLGYQEPGIRWHPLLSPMSRHHIDARLPLLGSQAPFDGVPAIRAYGMFVSGCSVLFGHKSNLQASSWTCRVAPSTGPHNREIVVLKSCFGSSACRARTLQSSKAKDLGLKPCSVQSAPISTPKPRPLPAHPAKPVTTTLDPQPRPFKCQLCSAQMFEQQPMRKGGPRTAGAQKL